MGNDWLLIGFAAFVLTGTGLAAALAAGERKSLPIAVQAWAAAVALALLAAGGAGGRPPPGGAAPSSIWGGPSSSSVRSPIPRQGSFANS